MYRRRAREADDREDKMSADYQIAEPGTNTQARERAARGSARSRGVRRIRPRGRDGRQRWSRRLLSRRVEGAREGRRADRRGARHRKLQNAVGQCPVRRHPERRRPGRRFAGSRRCVAGKGFVRSSRLAPRGRALFSGRDLPNLAGRARRSRPRNPVHPPLTLHTQEVYVGATDAALSVLSRR